MTYNPVSSGTSNRSGLVAVEILITVGIVLIGHLLCDEQLLQAIYKDGIPVAKPFIPFLKLHATISFALNTLVATLAVSPS